MRLWLRVMRGSFLLIAAVFAVVAVAVPEARAAALAIVAISIGVALLGIPAVGRLFRSITGDERVLESGIPGWATITALEPTGLRYNRYYPVVRFRLSLQRADGTPVEVRQAVAPDVLERLAPGVVVAVRIDRADARKVVIDWRQAVRTAT